MASPTLVLPGVLFVGEDDRARIVAHTGPAAGWHVPRGILGWSTEVSFVERSALTEDIRRATKVVMPAEQIPPARMPLTSQAAQKSPLVAVSSRLVPKLVEAGIRVHTVGVDRLTSSFYYLAEGGSEDQIRVEGDLVQAVGEMLGERADNAAIERVLDGLPDRLLRALSKDRLSELTVELAAALPRAAADGSGTQDLDLDAFEKALSGLVGGSEKHTNVAQEIASKLAEAHERRVEVPLFGEARKVSQGPFDIAVGEQRVSLPTYERWLMGAPVAAAASVAPPAAVEPVNTERAAAAAQAAHDAAIRHKLEAAAAQADAEMKAEADAKAEADRKAAAEEKAAAAAAKAKADEDAKIAAEAAAAAKAKADEAKAAEEEIAAAKAADARVADAAKAEAKKAEDAIASAAKAAEKKAFEAKKAEQKAAKKGDKKPDGKRDASPKGAQASAKAKVADDRAADTVKIKKSGSHTMIWIVALALVAGGVVLWRAYFTK